MDNFFFEFSAAERGDGAVAVKQFLAEHRRTRARASCHQRRRNKCPLGSGRRAWARKQESLPPLRARGSQGPLGVSGSTQIHRHTHGCNLREVHVPAPATLAGSRWGVPIVRRKSRCASGEVARAWAHLEVLARLDDDRHHGAVRVPEVPCLKDFWRSHRFSVFFESLRAHINRDVLRAAFSVNMWICVIPSKWTWCLQPCDTQVFVSHRQLLDEEVQRRSGLTASGDVNWEIVMEAMWPIVVVFMLVKDWPRSFASVGIPNEQGHVCEQTLQKFQSEPTAMETPARYIPTLSELIHISQRV